jgi:nucleoside-diphosphate-sugar epimerase
VVSACAFRRLGVLARDLTRVLVSIINDDTFLTLVSVLVTGGAGFVGSYVVRDLLLEGNQVIVYDAHTESNALDLVLPQRPRSDVLTVVQGAISDTWRLFRLCEEREVDRIVHLASPLTQDVVADPTSGIRDICGGTAAIFELARAFSIHRVVWASSVAVFGGRSLYGDVPVPNDALHRPENLHGSCKSLCERMALDYRSAYGVDSIGLRLSVVYGPARLREEVAAMLLRALNRAVQPRDIVFNTCGEVRTFREVAVILSRLAPDANITLSTEAADDGQLMLQEAPIDYDDSVFRAQLAYEPRYQLEQGIEASIIAFRRMAEFDQPLSKA